ncbi:MAG: IS66 family transposase [Planctomycetes bacterium]|nr:IS66 family transposase [Planctomycetota bacterium]
MDRNTLERLSKTELIEIVLRLDVQVAALEARCAALEVRCAKLEEENAALKDRCVTLESELAKARKNSSNSSKPPSSDIVKPPRSQGTPSNGKIGGQPGHPRHMRPPFPPEQVDRIKEHKLDRCPDCGGAVRPLKLPSKVVQQVELVKKPVFVTEHRAFACQCRSCGRIHYGRLPPEVRAGGLTGPRLTALLVYLKGACHASYTTVQAFLAGVVGLRVSCGYLAKQIRKVTRALDGPYQELALCLPSEPHLGVDETGHKEKGRTLWTWCFRSERFALFRIAASRGSDVLRDSLGREFKGTLSSDYFGAYRKYAGETNGLAQFCLAHLIRDLRFLLTLSDRATQNYAERLLQGLRRLFRVIHRRGKMTEERFRRALEHERRELMRTGRRAPMGVEAQNMADRFRKHGDSYFRFITTPGVEPTNNLTEQALRFIVIDRRVTQGTRGRTGRRWCERIWTALATCALQHRSSFDYLHRAVQAHLTEQAVPSLIAPASS